jgi:hypothetical protein
MSDSVSEPDFCISVFAQLRSGPDRRALRGMITLKELLNDVS